jgi:rfaE bifunctional protein kinase chain/domain
MLISDLVNQFRNQAILVTGDTYIDHEIYGNVLRLAPEAPVPVVKVRSKRFIPGGAANIAKNISLLGGTAFLYGYFGADDASQEILYRLHLDRIQVPSSPPSPTLRLPERFRIFAANQQLLQILQKPAEQLPPPVLQPLPEFVAASALSIQVLVIYDQGYGFVTESFLDSVNSLTEQYPLKVIIDAHPEHIQWYEKAAL